MKKRKKRVDEEKIARRRFEEGKKEFNRKTRDGEDPKNKFENCLILFTEAVKRNPLPKYYFHRANTYRNLEEYKLAERDYLYALGKKENPEYYVERAINQRLISQKERSSRELVYALEYLNRAIEIGTRIGKKSTNYFFNRGILHYEMSKFRDFKREKMLNEAINDLTKAYESNPGPLAFNILFHRGNTYREKGELDRSISDLLQASERTNNEHPGVCNNLGLSYYEKKEYYTACDQFTSAINADPDHSVYYNNKGLAHYQLQEFKDAIHNFNIAIEKNKMDGIFYFNRGNAYLAIKEYQLAISDFEDAQKNRLDINIDYRMNICQCIGMCYEEMGDIPESIIHYKEALKYDPIHAESNYHLGLMYHANGNNNKAKEQFLKVIEIEAENQKVWESLGLVYQDLLDFSGSVNCFDHALQLCDSSKARELYYYRGTSYCWLGKYEAAIEDFNKALSLSSQKKNLPISNKLLISGSALKKKYLKIEAIPDSQILNARSIAYKFIGNFKQCIQDLEDAIVKDEGNPEYLFNRAQTYYDLEMYQKSIIDLTRAIKVDETESKFYYLRGSSLYSLKNFKKAIHDLKLALRLNTKAVFAHDCYFRIGVCYSYLKKEALATEAFSRAINLKKDEPIAGYYHWRAKSFQSQGMNSEALSDFQIVSVMEPKNAKAHYRMAFAYKALKQFDRAAEEFELAKKLEPSNANLVVNYKKIYKIPFIDIDKKRTEEEEGEEEY